MNVNPLPIALYDLELADIRYREAAPRHRERLGVAFVKAYFKVYRMMTPGQVYEWCHWVVTRTEGALVIDDAKRAERRAS